jgi:hypothetical protein
MIPKAKYTVGDPVIVECMEGENFPATVTRVWWDNIRSQMDYEVMEESGVKTDGYTEEWFSPQNRPIVQSHEI